MRCLQKYKILTNSRAHSFFNFLRFYKNKKKVWCTLMTIYLQKCKRILFKSRRENIFVRISYLQNLLFLEVSKNFKFREIFPYFAIGL